MICDAVWLAPDVVVMTNSRGSCASLVCSECSNRYAKQNARERMRGIRKDQTLKRSKYRNAVIQKISKRDPL
jgi:ABC-type taurine transport system ATPase subunit